MSNPQIPSPPVTERERFWAALIQQRAECGKSLREFAAAKGVVASTLAWWGSEIKRRKARRAGQASRASRPPKSIPFIPVTVAQDRVDTIFEVALPGGAAVRVPTDFDADSLRRLIRVLEATC